MDLEENGYVTETYPFFYGFKLYHFKFKIKRFFMDVLVNELLMRNIQLPFLV